MHGIVIAFAVVSGAGCGDDVTVYSVTGSVKLPDDRPLVGATVTFKSVDGDSKIRPRGQTDEDGKFELRLDETHKGAPPGSYQITVAEAFGDDIDARPKPKIHPRYANFEKSGLQFTVKQGSNNFDIEVDPFRGRK